ncbi:MAG: hypothetical protein AAF391_00345 [Bacteroidota bacterium]
MSIHLSVLIFSFSIALGIWVGFWNNWHHHILSLNLSYNAIPFLFGPAIYLHLKAAHGDSRLVNSLHYIPFLMVFSFFLPFYLMDAESKLHYIQLNVEDPNFVIRFTDFLQSASLISYLFLLFRFSVVDQKKEKWTKVIRICFLIFVLIYISNVIVVQFTTINLLVDIASAFIMSITIYSIGYMSFNRISIFKRLDLAKPDKYNRSPLTSKHAEIIVKKLQSFLIQDKAFKSPEMSLANVAKRIETPTHYLSESLNKYRGINFSDFINRLRVEEAKVDKVAIVRRRKTGEKVAEITMDDKGLFLTERMAVTTDVRTGKKTAETRGERKGIIYPERTARTYNQKTGKRTHETTNEKRGILFRERYTKTENVETGKVSETRAEKRGFFWPSWIFRSDKK